MRTAHRDAPFCCNGDVVGGDLGKSSPAANLLELERHARRQCRGINVDTAAGKVVKVVLEDFGPDTHPVTDLIVGTNAIKRTRVTVINRT